MAGAFREVLPAPSGTPHARFCVYTALFGSYDNLRPPVQRPEGVDFICFTDQPVEAPGWTVVTVEADSDSVLQSRHYKLFPHLHLSAYEASLYVDANVLVCGDLDRFVRRWCAHEEFVAWNHRSRDDLQDEAIAILGLAKHEPRAIVRQIETYLAAGIPRSTGLVEASFIWRRHDSEPVRQLMSVWWEEIVHQSRRDQLSLCFLMWKTSIRPKVLPDALGDAHASSVAVRLPHNSRHVRAKHAVAGGRRRLCFLFSEDFRTSGSTILRGQQLAELMRERYPDAFDVSYTSQLDLRDAIVVLTKGALISLKPEQLRALKRVNIALVGDYVDRTPNEDVVPLLDLLLASSIRGFAEASRKFWKARSEYLPHHVDLRIAPGVAPKDRFSVGYFGEAQNVVRYPTIEALVDFADTSGPAPDWMARLSSYSLHYAVRPKSKAGHHGEKPFLKGFTAARCGANIIVTDDDGDARYYLGDDYPYLLRSRSESDVRDMLLLAKETFGGPEWVAAQNVMARVRAASSASYVAEELRRILQSL